MQLPLLINQNNYKQYMISDYKYTNCIYLQK